MPRPVPPPVAAAIALVPAALDSARRAPGKAVQLPVLAISHALTTIETVKREYGELADRGQKVVAKLRGASFDELEDKVEDALQGTPLAGAYDKVEDTLEDAVERAKDAGDKAAARLKAAPDLASDLADELKVPEAEKAKGAPTRKAPAPATARIDTAATPAVVEAVEQAAAAVTTGPVTGHDDLPLADYDHLTLGSLRGRLRSLALPELVQVRDYEKAHADRLPVVTMLDNRIAKLATTSEPPAPAPSPVVPEKAPKGTSKTAKAAKGKVGGPAAATTTAPRTKVRTT